MLRRTASCCHLLLLLLVLEASLCSGITFELPAVPFGADINEGGKCFSMYFGKDVLVRGLTKTTQVGGPNQHLDVTITDGEGNLIYSKKDSNGENKIVFTTHSYSDIKTCFLNYLDPGNYPNKAVYRTITFELDYSFDSDIAKPNEEHKQALKPIEKDLRHLEQVVLAVVDEMEYLKQREARLRDTNESTHERVHLFSILSICTLIGSGLWQIYYLRKFFQTKKLL